MAQPDGASGTDPNAPQSGGTGTGDGTGATGAQSGTPEAGAGSTPEGAAASGQTVSQAEYEALKARMVAADQRAAAEAAKYKQLVEKDLPELDKLKGELQETQTREKAATEALSSLQIENAFLKDNTFTWQNPATALKLLDRSKITVDQTSGEISGMKQALEALSKSDAYLLKPAAAPEGGDNTPPLGTPPANGGAGATNGNTKAQQVKRFPAMRDR